MLWLKLQAQTLPDFTSANGLLPAWLTMTTSVARAPCTGASASRGSRAGLPFFRSSIAAARQCRVASLSRALPLPSNLFISSLVDDKAWVGGIFYLVTWLGISAAMYRGSKMHRNGEPFS